MVVVLFGSLYMAYARIELPETLPPIRTSYLYDRNGVQLTSLHGAVDRKIVGLKLISENLQHAVLATEDAGFYEHPGIDVSGIVSAAWTDLVKRDTVVGRSTITQQLVKNVYAGEYIEHPNGVQEYVVPPRSIKEKIREALLAIKVEQELSKDQILAKYLNTVYFGHGAYGAEAAAQTYFDKPASDLTVSEAAVLAAVLHAPSLYDPIKSKYDNEFRRDYTLDQMAKYGYIPRERGRTAEGAEVLWHPQAAEAGAGPHLEPGRLRVLRRVDPLAPVRGVRQRARLRRRSPDHVDARPEAATHGRGGRRGEPARFGLQPRRGARDDRQRDGRGARDGRRTQLEGVEAEPRDASVRGVRPSGGLGVQALHARRRPRPRLRAGRSSTGPARRRSRSPTSDA